MSWLCFQTWEHVGCGYEREAEEVLLASFVNQRDLMCGLYCCAMIWFFFLVPFNSGLSTFLLLLFCRNPYGQSVGNHGAGLDHFPREWGELVHAFSLLCVLFFLWKHLFHLLVNSVQSALNSTPPTVLYLCFCCLCLLSWILKSKWETPCVTLYRRNRRVLVFRPYKKLLQMHRNFVYCILEKQMSKDKDT